MSTDEKTDPQGPLAKLLEAILSRKFDEWEGRFGLRMDGIEERIVDRVSQRLDPKISRVSIAQLSSEARVRELEREVQNLKEIVYSQELTDLIRYARGVNSRADTSILPPPPSPDEGGL